MHIHIHTHTYTYTQCHYYCQHTKQYTGTGAALGYIVLTCVKVCTGKVGNFFMWMLCVLAIAQVSLNLFLREELGNS